MTHREQVREWALLSRMDLFCSTHSLIQQILNVIDVGTDPDHGILA